jgi:thiol-disulfide isomerase/thioredoxin
VRKQTLLGMLVVPVVAAFVLAGCTETPDYGQSSSNGYVSGAGVYKEIKPADRKQPLSFSSKLDTGAKITSAELKGKVYVVNFWYAGCAPCNSEAPRLNKVYEKYKGSVGFLGVNTYDQAATAKTFEQAHDVKYPSAIDTNTASVQYAFSSYVPPSAVPTTLVLDKQGRVAARVTGELDDASILESLIATVIHEGQ